MPEAAALGARLALTMLEHARAQPAGRASLLNVNIPSGSSWQVRATRLGARLYSEDVVYRQDPRGNEYLWIGGGAVRHDLVAGSDTEAFDAGHASITPLTIDPSCHEQQDLALKLAAAFQRPS
jgi:5'-nucleotidase